MADSELAFWRWFEANRQRLSGFEPGDDDVLDDIHDALTSYCDGLVFEISQPLDGIRDFVVSADGIAELFPHVTSLCQAAPELDGWRIVAFRPRMELHYSLDFDGRTFDPSKIWFHEITRDGEFDLILFVPDFSEAERDLIVNACYVLLDMALGEYDVTTGIRYLDHQPLPESPAEEGLKPLEQLSGVFDAFFGRAA